MGGRFGKYGDLKRKDALRRSRKEKARLERDKVQKTRKRRKPQADLVKK